MKKLKKRSITKFLRFMLAMLLSLTLSIPSFADTNQENDVNELVPTVKNEVKNKATNEWGEITDAEIGDDVEFRIISTIPANVTDFNHYCYLVGSKFDEGLTCNCDYVIKINDAEELPSKYFTHHMDNDDLAFTLNINISDAIKDGKLKVSDKLYIYYTEKVNKYTKAQNRNAVSIMYSDNPYEKNSFDYTKGSNMVKVNVQQQ